MYYLAGELPCSSEQGCRLMHLALIIWPPWMNQPWPGSISVAASPPPPNCAKPASPSSGLTAKKAAEQIMRNTENCCTNKEVKQKLARTRPDLVF